MTRSKNAHYEETLPCELTFDEPKPKSHDIEPQPASLLLELAEQAQHHVPALINGILVGRLIALDSPATPRVAFPNAPPNGLPARAMLTLTPNDIGREVALMFEGGDPMRPIVMGRMATAVAEENPPVIEAEVDDRHVEIEAQEQLVLRCGESSITLTRSGKIIIRGTYILSRSSGVNRIQGGSVEIN